MKTDIFDLESFEDSLNRFQSKLKRANSDRPAGDDKDESDKPYYTDLDETAAATGKAVKRAII